jgi:hypothetical protein
MKRDEYSGTDYNGKIKKWRNTAPPGGRSVSQHQYICEISSSHGEEYEDQSLEGSKALFLNFCRTTKWRS